MLRKIVLLPYGIAAVLLALAVGCAAADPGGGPRVVFDADFDNAWLTGGSREDRYLQLLVTAPQDETFREEADRRPLNIALVIDRSGSMNSEGKLEYAKEAAMRIVDRLRHSDRFSLIVYDNEVRTLIPSRPLENRNRARQLIRSLTTGGSTNLGGGLQEGYRQISRHLDGNGVNRVLLLTDGLANVGTTSPRQLFSIASRWGRKGISLSTFGVGLEFNENLLTALSESGRGNYYFIDEPGRIPEILAREFRTVEETVALDMTLTIDLNSALEIDELLGYGFERRGNSITIRIGDLAAGERRRFMIRLRTPAYDIGARRAGRARMSYQPVGSSSRVTTAKELRFQVVENAGEAHSHLDEKVTERVAIYEAHEARRKAADAFDSGDLDGARRLLKTAQERIEASPVQTDRVRDELEETAEYGARIEERMSRSERSALQKKTKYDSELNFGC